MRKNMKRNFMKLIPVIIVLLILVACLVWTYSSLDKEAETVSYIADALIIIMLFIILFFNSRSKLPQKQPKFQDMITEGSVDNNNRLNINIFSLEDLVKLAMDLDKRVIHDPKVNKYYAFSEDIAYIYDPGFINMMLDNKQQIGKLLLDRGLIQPEQLEIGLFYQKKVGSRLGDSLIALGFIDETTLYSTLAAQQEIAYYELNPDMDISDTGWITTMSISKARALQVLPVGYREDGKLVIACGESAMTGIKAALQEMFGNDIYIVAARPSHIYEVLERIENRIQEEKDKDSFAELVKLRKIEPYERLSNDEWQQFAGSYNKGRLDTALFIKAAGLANPTNITQMTDKDTITSWLSGKYLISGEYLNLINALSKLIRKQDQKSRQNRVMPELLELLKEACYITDDASEWIENEAKANKKPLVELLESNYLVSGMTIGSAGEILNTLKKVLNKPKMF